MCAKWVFVVGPSHESESVAMTMTLLPVQQHSLTAKQ